MQIEVGKTYADGTGREHTIKGPAKSDPIDGEKVYWSLDGFWYTETGKHVEYHRHLPPDGSGILGNEYRHCIEHRSMRDLVEKARGARSDRETLD